MDKVLEQTIRMAAKLGEEANCPTQLTPVQIGTLLGEIDQLRTVVHLLLDQVDYTEGNCRPNEMVGAVLPMDVIAIVKAAVK